MSYNNSIVEPRQKDNTKRYAGKAHIQFLKPDIILCPLVFTDILIYSSLANRPPCSLRALSKYLHLDRIKTIKPALERLQKSELVELKNTLYFALPPTGETKTWFRRKTIPNTDKWQGEFFYLPIYETQFGLTTRQSAVYWAILDYPSQKALYYANGLKLSRQNVYHALHGQNKGKRPGLLELGLVNATGGKLAAPPLADEQLVAATTETAILDFIRHKMPVDRDWDVFWDQAGFLKGFANVSEKFLATRHYSAKQLDDYWRWLLENLEPEWVENIVMENYKGNCALVAHVANHQKYPGNKFLIGATQRIIDQIKKCVANAPAGSVSPVSYTIPPDFFQKSPKNQT